MEDYCHPGTAGAFNSSGGVFPPQGECRQIGKAPRLGVSPKPVTSPVDPSGHVPWGLGTRSTGSGPYWEYADITPLRLRRHTAGSTGTEPVAGMHSNRTGEHRDLYWYNPARYRYSPYIYPLDHTGTTHS